MNHHYKNMSILNKISVSLTVMALATIISVPKASALSPVYDGTILGTPSGQLLTGFGDPSIHIYGLQFYNGSTAGAITVVDFQINATNTDPNDKVYGTIWSYSGGIMTQIATSSNSFTADKFSGNLSVPMAASFTFSPAVDLKANGLYLIAIKAVNSGSTNFVIYGNSDPSLMVSNDFASCKKYSGTDLKITGALGYIADNGTIGWKSCGSLVGASIIGSSIPVGAIKSTASYFEGYAKPGTVVDPMQVVNSQAQVVGNVVRAPQIQSAAQTANPSSGNNTGSSQTDNPSDASFKLAWCDGPDLTGVNFASSTDKARFNNSASNYVPCNFPGLVGQIQHLLNAAFVFGVFIAIAGFLWSGFLFIKGDQESRKKGKAILPKILIGFIIMICAWFIVIQLMTWLGADPKLISLINGK